MIDEAASRGVGAGVSLPVGLGAGIDPISASLSALATIGASIPGSASAFGLNKGEQAQAKLAAQQIQAQNQATLDQMQVSQQSIQAWKDTALAVAPYAVGAVALVVGGKVLISALSSRAPAPASIARAA